jgi:hypothetical protein
LHFIICLRLDVTKLVRFTTELWFSPKFGRRNLHSYSFLKLEDIKWRKLVYHSYVKYNKSYHKWVINISLFDFPKSNLFYFYICILDLNIIYKYYYFLIIYRWPSWPWSYCSWIYNYLCNQCLSPLMLYDGISMRARCTTLCDLWQVCGFLRVLRFPLPIKLTAMI